MREIRSIAVGLGHVVPFLGGAALDVAAVAPTPHLDTDSKIILHTTHRRCVIQRRPPFHPQTSFQVSRPHRPLGTVRGGAVGLSCAWG